MSAPGRGPAHKNTQNLTSVKKFPGLYIKCRISVIGAGNAGDSYLHLCTFVCEELNGLQVTGPSSLHERCPSSLTLMFL